MRIRLASLLVAVAMLGAACAGQSDSASETRIDAAPASGDGTESADEPEPSDTADESGEAEAEAEPPPESDEPSINEATTSPIREVLGVDPADSAEAANEYVRLAEELVRQCMAEAGFDYIPNNPSLNPSFARFLELEDSLSREQFAAEYGYGIASLFELSFDKDGVLQFVDNLLGPAPTDARSEGEQAAYEKALTGSTIQGLDAEDAQDSAFEGAPGVGEEGSCKRYGYDTAESPQGAIFDGLQSLLGDELASLDERFENDPRIRDMQREWQVCMAEAGYSYEHPDEIREEIQTSAFDIGDRLQQSPAVTSLFQQAIGAGLAGMDAESRYDFLDNAGAFRGFSMVPALQAELDALIDVELATAARDAECTDQSVVDQVQFEVEQAFVEEHAEQLELVLSGAE